jgi:DNA replication protein DnaC
VTITIRHVPLEHRLFHFRLAYSGWCHVRVVLGGESYTALAEGLPEALEHLGGVPREHRTDSLEAYRVLVGEVASNINRRNRARITAERAALAPLPFGRGRNYTEAVVRVTSSSTFTYGKVLYSVPARLIGERLRVHVYDDRLVLHHGGRALLTLTRLRLDPQRSRRRCIDYRHVIGWLAHKPRALAGLAFRDELLPTLPLLLRQLRLPTMAAACDDLLAQAVERGWSVAATLATLCEYELAEREHRRFERHLHEARLPTGKTLEAFDFQAIQGADRSQLSALACDNTWIDQARNLLLFGPSGVGKSHLAAAIGHALIEQGLRVRYFAASALVQELQFAKQALRLSDALTKLDKYRLLVIDDIGYVQRTDEQTGSCLPDMAVDPRAADWSGPRENP